VEQSARNPSVAASIDQSSPAEHDPRSAGVTADNFIDNCHASNHAQRAHVHARGARTLRARASQTAIELPHRYRASLGNRHPSTAVEIRVHSLYGGGTKGKQGHYRGQGGETARREHRRVLSARKPLTDRGVAFKRR